LAVFGHILRTINKFPCFEMIPHHGVFHFSMWQQTE